jgi:hypothetical protein
MQELEKRIGLLRLLLADIEGKQAQLIEIEGQYRSQLSRIVDFVVYKEGDVSNALSLMTEVQSKLDEVVLTANHLTMIGQRAGTELEVLVMTKRVADARSQLAKLEERQQELAARLSYMSAGGDDAPPAASEGANAADVQDIRGVYEEVEREIARLNNLISEVSERAARTIHSRGKEK